MNINLNLSKVMSDLCCIVFCFGICIEIVSGQDTKRTILFKRNKTSNSSKTPSKWIQRQTDDAFFPIVENMDISTSRHVAFTDKKPVLPPSADFKNSQIVDLKDLHMGSNRIKSKSSKGKLRKRNNKNRFRKKQRRHRIRHSRSRFRSKRSHVTGEASSVCTSISKWVTPSNEETLDQWGQTVTILPHIMVGSRQIQQFIYETSCLEDNVPCKGIDKRHYKSECNTKKVYAYAYVRSSTGEENWSYIEINGYCNCKLQRKHHSGPRNILDYLNFDTK